MATLPPTQHYKLYELTLSSELPLPELLPLESASNPAQILVRYGKVAAEGLHQPSYKGLHYQTAEQCLWLEISGLARFLVRDGQQIIIEAMADADEQSIRLYVLGSCMGALLQQRGLLVLHANAVAIGRQAVVFAGPSGQGKSTLAAAFHQQGYAILSDDVCAINQQLQVVPGYPQLKLWSDSAKQLNISTRGLQRIRLQVNKYAMPLTQGFASQNYPIAAIFFLHSHNDDTIRFEAAKGWTCYQSLKANSYRMGYSKGMGLEKHHLKQCSRLSNQASLWHLYRPDQGFALEKLLHALALHFQQMGLLA